MHDPDAGNALRALLNRGMLASNGSGVRQPSQFSDSTHGPITLASLQDHCGGAAGIATNCGDGPASFSHSSLPLGGSAASSPGGCSFTRPSSEMELSLSDSDAPNSPTAADRNEFDDRSPVVAIRQVSTSACGNGNHESQNGGSAGDNDFHACPRPTNMGVKINDSGDYCATSGTTFVNDVSSAVPLRYRNGLPAQEFTWLQALPREIRRKLRTCQMPEDARAVLADTLAVEVGGSSLSFSSVVPPAGLLEDLQKRTVAAQRRALDLEEELRKQSALQDAELSSLLQENRRGRRRAKLQVLAQTAPQQPAALEALSYASASIEDQPPEITAASHVEKQQHHIEPHAGSTSGGGRPSRASSAPHAGYGVARQERPTVHPQAKRDSVVRFHDAGANRPSHSDCVSMAEGLLGEIAARRHRGQLDGGRVQHRASSQADARRTPPNMHGSASSSGAEGELGGAAARISASRIIAVPHAGHGMEGHNVRY